MSKILMILMMISSFAIYAETKTAQVAAEQEYDWSFVPEVVLQIDDFILKKEDLILKIKEFIKCNEQQCSHHHSRELDEIKEIANGYVTREIDKNIMLNLAKKIGIIPSEALVLKVLLREKSTYTPERLESFNLFLKEAGVTEEEYFKEGMKNKEIQIKLAIEEYKKVAIIDKIIITEQQVKDEYETNIAKYTQKEYLSASHILIKPKGREKQFHDEAIQKIKAIQERLKNGEDFAQIAKTESQCGSSIKGGDLGMFERGKMVAEFEKALFKLEEGEVSQIVTSFFGYHIIKAQKGQEYKVFPLDEELKKDISIDLQYKQANSQIDNIIKKEIKRRNIINNLN